MPELIQLTEYRPSQVALEEPDLVRLLELVRGSGESEDAKVIQSITPTRQSGRYLVTPGPFVGRMGLPSGATLDIRSRFPLSDTIELIRRSGRLPIRLDRMKPMVSPDTFVVDVIAEAYTREVERLLSFGLAKGYQSRRFERPPFPGRPDVNRQLSRYAGRPDKLVTTARRITHDIDVNRALAAALEVIRRVPLPEGTARRVAALVPGFTRVGAATCSADDVARLVLDRQTIRYAEALGLAEVILRSQSLTPVGASMAGATVLFNMPKVWEGVVANWVTEMWPDHEIRAPYPFRVTADGTLTAEADVTVWSGDELVALYDAKYKWPGEKPSMGDVYQMVTYCTRLGIDTATLVYPVAVPTKRFQVGGVTIGVLGFDLSRPRVEVVDGAA